MTAIALSRCLSCVHSRASPTVIHFWGKVVNEKPLFNSDYFQNSNKNEHLWTFGFLISYYQIFAFGRVLRI